MSRSEQHTQGYRHAAKDAIEWLHQRAASMNDPHAKTILNGAAFELGVELSRRDTIPTKGQKTVAETSE